MRVSLRSKILGLCLLTSAMVQPAFADQAKCSCRNLRSVQEELKNAEYEAMFFADMAAKLKAVEDPLIEAHKNPIHPDSDVNIQDRSSRARADVMRTFKLPHNPAYGYSGPLTVDMKFGSCEQKPADLEALRAGSQVQGNRGHHVGSRGRAQGEMRKGNRCGLLGQVAQSDRRRRSRTLSGAGQRHAGAAQAHRG